LDKRQRAAIAVFIKAHGYAVEEVAELAQVVFGSCRPPLQSRSVKHRPKTPRM